eukprot:4924277-Karenia_brevis.AAC.1
MMFPFPGHSTELFEILLPPCVFSWVPSGLEHFQLFQNIGPDLVFLTEACICSVVAIAHGVSIMTLIPAMIAANFHGAVGD